MAAPAVRSGVAPIVVADGSDAAALLGPAPAGLPIAVAATLEDASRIVTADTPLVLCDCHFDDGRMYDLLRWMKASPQLARVPFLAVRLRAGELDDAMYESVNIATSALGADGFVDLYRWTQHHGPAEAAQRLERRIAQLARGRGSSVPDAA